MLFSFFLFFFFLFLHWRNDGMVTCCVRACGLGGRRSGMDDTGVFTISSFTVTRNHTAPSHEVLVERCRKFQRRFLFLALNKKTRYSTQGAPSNKPAGPLSCLACEPNCAPHDWSPGHYDGIITGRPIPQPCNRGPLPASGFVQCSAQREPGPLVITGRVCGHNKVSVRFTLGCDRSPQQEIEDKQKDK